MFEFIILILLLVFLIFIGYFLYFSPGSQVVGKVIFGGNRDKKFIAITFDDGPNEPYTSQILDILKQFQIKATFFPVGENIIRHPEILKKMVEEGHEIGNHSFSHALLRPVISPSYRNEITKTQDLIKDVIGQKPTLFRPPWFFRTSAMLITTKKLGLTSITGTFASYWEVFQVSPDRLAKDAIGHTRPGTILVFHDGYNNRKARRSKTVEAIKIVIPALIKLGYKFVTVSEMINNED